MLKQKLLDAATLQSKLSYAVNTCIGKQAAKEWPWVSYLFEAVLAEALFALLGEADWKSSGYNWPGTDSAVLKFLVH